jgi:NAD(P)-dependent dehydrogenase (short-subunit alcohol dehydrogenase family)
MIVEGMKQRVRPMSGSRTILSGPRMARRVLDMGVRLNAVCPGRTETGVLESFMQGAGNPDKLREAYRRPIPTTSRARWCSF